MQSSKPLRRLTSQIIQKYRRQSAIISLFGIRSTFFPRSKYTVQVTHPCSARRQFSTSILRMSSSSTTMNTPPIHIIGLGNLGKLFAHSLTTNFSSPTQHSEEPSSVTILTHRSGLPYAFQQSGSAITILRNGIVTSTPPDLVKIEPIQCDDPEKASAPIRHLIVTTKAADTASALKPLVSRLNSESTILFTQNGVGVIDEVNDLCFPCPQNRPSYLTAIVVHGVFSTGPFSATHAAVADLKIGHTFSSSSSSAAPISVPSQELISQSANELLNKIVATESLVAKEVEPRELIAVQLEKLIVNACINPLTVIFRTLNGGLLNPLVSPLRRALCEEGSAVFMQYLNSTTGLDSELKERFDVGRLEQMVRDVTERVRENKSSMYQDLDAGRKTEVRYINGWFSKRGDEYGIDVRTHNKLVELVEAEEEVKMDDIAELFPRTKATT